MSTRILQLASNPARRTLCRTCLLRSIAATRQQCRPIHLGTLSKRRLAEEAWEERAERIKNGKEASLWDTFKERGYVKDIAGTDEQIRELMRLKRIGVYVGIDPTAESLHLGHLLPLMPLFSMYMNGYQAVTLVGGATAKVGDPTDRLQTRSELSKADRSKFATKIHYQLKSIWLNVDRQAERYGYKKEWAWKREVANNSSWYNSTPFFEVVNRLFKGMRVGTMLSRETVKRKMTEGDGMSLAEFIYPMMQAWDWWAMFSRPTAVHMQIGGSDQFGNIVAGVDAVKYLRDTHPDLTTRIPDDLLHTPVGFTVPLLTDSAGNKFGKSAGNAMWLDPYMTPTFDLYGYFMRRPDDDVEKLLKLFTFIPLDQISKIMKQHNLDPSKRHAHHILAFEVLALVCGLTEAEATQTRHKQMFSKDKPLAITPTSTGEVKSYPPRVTPPTSSLALGFRRDIQLPESLIMGKSIAHILYASGLAESANDAHRLIVHSGAYVGGAPGRSAHNNVPMHSGEVTFQPVKNWFPGDTKNFLIDGKLLILRRGKHFVRIVEMISDEEWKESGKSYPGEPGKGRLRLLRERLIAANNGKNPQFTSEEVARVGEELARIEREGEIALEDANSSSPPEIKFPPQRTRAAHLLDKYTRAKQLNPHVTLTVQQKTAAIDKVISDAKQVLEEKKRMRDEALAKAPAAAGESESGKDQY
ncbi:tRNA synthetase class I [Xylaria venustula]|nr:tRNA synthetase class I [Xylaria venustula]